MLRLSLIPMDQVPQEMHSIYKRVTAVESGLADTYRALFSNPNPYKGGQVDERPAALPVPRRCALRWGAERLGVVGQEGCSLLRVP